MDTRQSHYPVGLVFEVAYPMFSVTQHLESHDRLRFVIGEGKFAREETVAIEVASLDNNRFAVSWQEKDRATVVNIQDFDAGVVHSYATLPNGTFLRNKGIMTLRENVEAIGDHSPRRNRRLVHDAMVSLFQKRDATAIDRFYSPEYSQHSPTMPAGREGLRSLVMKMDRSVFYEPGMIVAEGDKVVIHGRIRGWSADPQVVCDIFRVSKGQLAEHWDVMQKEVRSLAAPMFDPQEEP